MARKRFGSYLVEEGFVTRPDLEHALEVQRVLRSTTFDEVLTELGLLSFDAIERYRARHHETLDELSRGSFETFLVDEGVITPAELARASRYLERLKRRRVGEVLVSTGALTRGDLDHVVAGRLQDLQSSGMF